MIDLTSIAGSVVIVAGASRGAGRGIAESLSDAGVIVYATGRSVEAAELPARVAVLPAGVFDLSNSESPQFLGQAIAALARDPNLLARSGEVLVAAALAREYGVTDVDGKSPTLLTIADV